VLTSRYRIRYRFSYNDLNKQPGRGVFAPDLILTLEVHLLVSPVRFSTTNPEPEFCTIILFLKSAWRSNWPGYTLALSQHFQSIILCKMVTTSAFFQPGAGVMFALSIASMLVECCTKVRFSFNALDYISDTKIWKMSFWSI
jgi:hypothetical protein